MIAVNQCVRFMSAVLVFAVAATCAGQQAEDTAHRGLIVRTQGAEQVLSLSDGSPFHRTANEVINIRSIDLDDSSIRLVLWDEILPTGRAQPFYAVSLDGQRVQTVRPTSYVLKIRHGDFDPLVHVPQTSIPADASNNLYIVQFVTQPLEEFRIAIRKLGGTVHSFLAHHAHIVKMYPEVRDHVAALPYVRWVGPFHPAYRLEEFMRDNRDRAEELFPLQRYNIQVFQAGPAQKSVVARRIEALGGMINMPDAGKFLLEATLTPTQLFEVIRWDEVLFVDRWTPYEKDMDIVRATGGADYIETVAGFTGTGVRGEVIDLGFNVGHVDFASRPLIQHTTVNNDSHGAATSGIVFGDGTGNPMGRGLLPDGQGIVADWDVVSVGTPRYVHTGELVEDPYYAVFQTASVGSGRTTEYTTVSADTDAALFDFDIIHCQSQSNAGSRNSRPQAWAKNIVSGGAVRHEDTATLDDDCWCGFASIGPASDGRIKPDLCFFNDNIFTVTTGSSTSYRTDFGGTSASTPIIAGHFGLFFQMWSEGVFGNEVDPGGTVFDNRPHMATAKAVMINTASPYPFTGATHDLNRVHQGWGLPDLQFLYDIRDRISVIDETELLANMESVELTALVDFGEPALRVTMVYADPPGNPAASQHRINDLTLKVTSPSGTAYWGNNGLLEGNWSIPGGDPNTFDTVENVFVENPEEGLWTLEVIASEIIEDGHVETPELDADFALVVSGALVATCTSEGRILLDDSEYGCESEVTIRVADCDLNTDNAVVDTVTITIASDTEPGGESVLLTETAPELGDFRGTVQMSAVDAAGVLQVAHADAITATYIDEDDGAGGIMVTVTAGATLDCQGPVISNVQITDISSDVATVTFDTDENATGTVRFGLSCDALNDAMAETDFQTTHSLRLDGLAHSTQYFIAVDAADEQGNESTDDAGGSCYAFSTLFVLYGFSLDNDPGWTTEGEWAYGQPTGGGSHAGDPTGGFTGNNVYGYNLFGDYPNDLPATYLTTTALDFAGWTDVRLKFWRWLGVESNSTFDEATIEASNNGTDWTVVWRATDGGVDISDSQWTPQQFDISAIADNQSGVFLRWGMGPTDAGTTFPGWNIDDVQFIATGGPLSISFPNGLPELLTPGTPTDVDVRIVGIDEAYVPDTAMLHYRYQGNNYATAPLTPLGGDAFRATLPPANCSDDPQFYFSAQGTTSGVVLQPPTAPSGTFTADVGEIITIFESDFEDATGWTVENVDLQDGAWDRGIPVDCSRGDPPTDFDGSGQCWLTDNSAASSCNSDVDGGPTRLVSPSFDLSGASNPVISYARWFTNDDQDADRMDVEISDDDGGSWALVESLTGRTGWVVTDVAVADFVTPSSQVRIRFSVTDNPNDSVSEGGVDAFAITTFACEFAFDCGSCTVGEWCRESTFECVPYGDGDFDGDGDINLSDGQRFTECFGSIADPVCEPGKLVGEGPIDLNDYAVFEAGLSTSGPQ